MDRFSLQLMPSSLAGKKARPLSLSTTTRPWLAQDWEKREVCTGGRGEDKREWKGRWEGRSGMGGEEGGSASELHSTPSVLSPLHPVPHSTRVGR